MRIALIQKYAERSIDEDCGTFCTYVPVILEELDRCVGWGGGGWEKGGEDYSSDLLCMVILNPHNLRRLHRLQHTVLYVDLTG